MGHRLWLFSRELKCTIIRSYQFFSDRLDFPGVPFSASDFNDYRCNSDNGLITNYGDVSQVRNCRLVGLVDLDHSKTDTRGKLIISLYRNSNKLGLLYDLFENSHENDLRQNCGLYERFDWFGSGWISSRRFQAHVA